MELIELRVCKGDGNLLISHRAEVMHVFFGLHRGIGVRLLRDGFRIARGILLADDCFKGSLGRLELLDFGFGEAIPG